MGFVLYVPSLRLSVYFSVSFIGLKSDVSVSYRGAATGLHLGSLSTPDLSPMLVYRTVALPPDYPWVLYLQRTEVRCWIIGSWLQLWITEKLFFLSYFRAIGSVLFSHSGIYSGARKVSRTLSAIGTTHLNLAIKQ